MDQPLYCAFHLMSPDYKLNKRYVEGDTMVNGTILCEMHASVYFKTISDGLTFKQLIKFIAAGSKKDV